MNDYLKQLIDNADYQTYGLQPWESPSDYTEAAGVLPTQSLVVPKETIPNAPVEDKSNNTFNSFSEAFKHYYKTLGEGKTFTYNNKVYSTNLAKPAYKSKIFKRRENKPTDFSTTTVNNNNNGIVPITDYFQGAPTKPYLPAQFRRMNPFNQ